MSTSPADDPDAGEAAAPSEPSGDDLDPPAVEPLADDPADTEEKVNESPLDDASEEDAATESDESTGEDSETTESSDDTEPATDAEGEDATDEVDTSDDLNPPSTDAPADDEPEYEYKALEEVEDEVRREIALGPAQERMTAILKAALAKVEDYQGDLTEFKAYPDTTEDPGVLDTDKLAAELNVEGGETEMLNILDMMDNSESELAQSYQTQFFAANLSATDDTFLANWFSRRLERLQAIPDADFRREKLSNLENRRRRASRAGVGRSSRRGDRCLETTKG